MLYDGKLWVGTGSEPAYLLGSMANRHGLIAGATGTGKTVTLKVMAEGFSDMGVPVFLADVKGDLAGMIKPGEHSDKLAERLAAVGVPNFQYKAYPTVFWDVYGEKGHPVRTTVSEMGPLLLSRMLGLNETQAGVLNILFRVADDEGMLLLDVKDLKAMLAYVGEHSREYTLNYGNVSAASIGAIQRAVAVLEDQGGDSFFGEPALQITDWISQNESGSGVINILDAQKLFRNPTMYSTFMLWMLSELYETLPEQGDSDKPRMVFFFDEAHLLFSDCPKAMMEKVEQVIRLIRSKGVGVYFITQNPMDVPMNVLGQLGNRVQHALRAFTPLDQKAVKSAAQTFRANPAFDTEEAITQLKTGEALVSFLDESGAPGVVSRATILPPQSYMGAVDDDLRRTFIETSPMYGVYDQAVDRQSAYEMLSGAFTGSHAAPAAPQPPASPTPVPVSTAPIQPSGGFMVYDAATGGYVHKSLPTPAEPAVPQPPVLQTMPVLVFDQASGQYVQQNVAMRLDPTTGRYVPAAPAAAVAPVSTVPAKPTREQLAAQRAAEKAQKDADAAARRAKADALRDERAQRARMNDSVLGRMKNTAISTVSREVTRDLTRGLLGSIKKMFK